MSDQIQFTETPNGLTISLSGMGTVWGFCSILLAAKFGTELRPDMLLSPNINSIFNALLHKLDIKENSQNMWNISSVEKLEERIAVVLRAYIKDHPEDSDFPELMKAALYPLNI